MKNIIELEAERLEWSLKTFPEVTPFSSLQKLKDEIAEVETELMKPDDVPQNHLAEEYADCLMCLFDSAGRAGFTADKIVEAFAIKLEKNKRRTWTKNANNIYSHIKETN